MNGLDDFLNCNVQSVLLIECKYTDNDAPKKRVLTLFYICHPISLLCICFTFKSLSYPSTPYIFRLSPPVAYPHMRKALQRKTIVQLYSSFSTNFKHLNFIQHLLSPSYHTPQASPLEHTILLL